MQQTNAFTKTFSVVEAISWPLEGTSLKQALWDRSAEDPACPAAIRESAWRAEVDIRPGLFEVTVRQGEPRVPSLVQAVPNRIPSNALKVGWLYELVPLRRGYRLGLYLGAGRFQALEAADPFMGTKERFTTVEDDGGQLTGIVVPVRELCSAPADMPLERFRELEELVDRAAEAEGTLRRSLEALQQDDGSARSPSS